MKRPAYPYILTALALSAVTLGFIMFASHSYHKEISMTSERELKATLEAGFAKLTLGRARTSNLFACDIATDDDHDATNFIDYSVRDKVGYLNLCTSDDNNHKKKSFHISGFDAGTWNTSFTDKIPISFDVELGLGRGDFDFTGLQVKDLNLSAGASTVMLRFNEPNKGEIEDLNIEAGLSKFEAKNLSNANFSHMKFEGGVGTYRLDFGGTIQREMDVDIELGLGSLTIILPEHFGGKVIYEKNIISNFDIDRDFTEQSDNNYVSSNYYSATGKINFRIEAGLGSVKIKRD
jgi:hypothetical protein